jgi:ribosome biogenesis GTPase
MCLKIEFFPRLQTPSSSPLTGGERITIMKKHLSNKQQQQITQRQAKHLTSSTHGLVLAHYGDSIEIETTDKQVVQCSFRQNLPTMVVGDTVVFEQDQNNPKQGSLLAHEPRRTTLWRRNKEGENKLIAANVDQVLIVIAPEPKRAEEVLDRYLVMTALQKLKAIIIFNKIDLLRPAELAAQKSYYASYEKRGTPVLFITEKEKTSIEPLVSLLKNKSSVFVGLSGVGKSSLIQSLLPEETVRISGLSVSGKTQMGRHTTSNSRLYHLPEGGNIIDSPGIREFAMQNLSQTEIEQGFPEFQSHFKQCKFRNCQHLKEPECGIRLALEKNEISQERWASYLRILKNTNL